MFFLMSPKSMIFVKCVLHAVAGLWSRRGRSYGPSDRPLDRGCMLGHAFGHQASRTRHLDAPGGLTSRIFDLRFDENLMKNQ